ncbi:cytochrome b/b6 domain-containing protein [Bradyrhizobium sp. SZCCHNRI1003]|uniref:cytochrome b/b6 domain-containing protein n=1 Tax=Bradyrhizobium sp. SZCCHNRI1003 TaxID=3057275 RepID=UPI0029162FE6|nr:cytochrome b/b6 domain-containing protein [Bradyrhizobium sp. SZCCHNRI1003]
MDQKIIVSTESVNRRSDRHPLWVRASHWLLAGWMLTLMWTGATIIYAHPRLYFGDVGNDLTPFFLEVPFAPKAPEGGWVGRTTFVERSDVASLSRTFKPSRQNSWARSLHFLMAWMLVLTVFCYVMFQIISGRLHRNLLPTRQDLTYGALTQDIKIHLHLGGHTNRSSSYGSLQKITYGIIIFIAVPMQIFTGLAMSPAVNAALRLSNVLGGYQSARTIHFILFAIIVIFLFVHVIMVFVSGAQQKLTGIIFGEANVE